jgi:FAD/FMN-containing dehydrogenase
MSAIILTTLLGILSCFGLVETRSYSSCRCRPSDSCWPKDADWDRLNQTVHGNLLALKPIASVCHDPNYNLLKCQTVHASSNDSIYRSNQPGALQWENWEAWATQNQSCYVETMEQVPCQQGRISLYSVQATTAADIQAAVGFAKDHNLRLAIRNSGHDFAGRSSSPDSLQISVHRMQNLSYTKDFKPAGSSKSEGMAVTVGAGVPLNQMYEWLKKEQVMIVGGFAHTVAMAGGYIAGGGHSMLGYLRGMAADNALEFMIVTPDVSVLRPIILHGTGETNGDCRDITLLRMRIRIKTSSGHYVAAVAGRGERELLGCRY